MDKEGWTGCWGVEEAGDFPFIDELLSHWLSTECCRWFPNEMGEKTQSNHAKM